MRAGDVLIGPYTGERYEVEHNNASVVTLRGADGIVEHWQPETLERLGYRVEIEADRRAHE